MAELNNKFKSLMEYGWQKLPNHAKEAMRNVIISDPDFLKKTIQRNKDILMKNYGIDESDLFDRYTMMNLVNRGNTELFDIEFINVYNRGPFSNLGSFIHNVMYQLCYEFPTKINSSDIDYLYETIRMLQWVSKMDESSVEKNAGQVSRIRDVKSRDKNGNFKFTSARFARAFNQQFPGWPEAFVDALNDVWKESYGVFDTSSYKIHIGRTEDHFLAAYQNTNLGPTSNITTTIFTKHLSNSCMQYDIYDEDGWNRSAIETGMHCTQAYATTDEDLEGLDYKRYFEIMYVTNSDDPFDEHATIYGRMIFSRDPDTGIPEFAPCYVVSNNIKSMMMIAAKDLGKDLSEEGKKEFEKQFKNFLDNYDHYNACDYPNIMDGAVLRALKANTGSNLSIADFISNSKDQLDTYLLSPYLDMGRKEGIVTPNMKNGKVYVSVNNKDITEFKTYDRTACMYIDKDVEMALFKIRLNNYEGINAVPSGIFATKCDHCGKKSFSIHSLRTENETIRVCSECKKFYARCYLTGKWDLIENMNKMRYLDVFPESLHPWKSSIISRLCVEAGYANENTDMHSCHIRQRDIGFYQSSDKYFSVDMRTSNGKIIPSVSTEFEIFENVVVNDTIVGLVEIYGQKFLEPDTRVCWDMINNKTVIDNEAKVVRITYNDNSIDIKIDSTSFNMISEFMTLEPKWSNGITVYRIGGSIAFKEVLNMFKTYREDLKISEGEIA